LWKIMDNGYGVCNGIARVEKYVLSRVGIESEEISSGRHSFLRLKNVSLPTKDGENITGDTILDPTWNLTAHRYGGRPQNFCLSYEEIRKHDIREDGTDQASHKNDKELSDVTLGLDDKSLREVFTSIGVADKNGDFPITSLLAKSKKVDEFFSGSFPEILIEKKLSILKEHCPEFATCQNSTMTALGLLINEENLNFNKCVVNRVYNRADEEKKPVVYMYVDLPNIGKKFYYADGERNQFVKISRKGFEERFECYEKDMQKQNGNRPWEAVKTKGKIEDLNRSSGRIVADEGSER
jgi:hypothetical protein